MIEMLSKDVRYKLPIYGGAADVKRGAVVCVGANASAATENGALKLATGSSAIPDIFGVIQEKLTYATDGETLVAGTSFVTKVVTIAHPWRIFRIPFDLTSLITCTQAVSTTTATVTSLEDDIDAAFLYVATGTGSGQTNYLTAAAAGSCTLKAAFGTSLDTTSKFVKILPKFHDIFSLTADGTMIASQAAAGAVKGMIVDTLIDRNGKVETLNPTKHAALTGLGTRLRFYADVAFRDTAIYTVD